MDRNITAMRKVNDEIGIVVEYPEKEVLRIPKSKHDFIVLEAKYFSGEIAAKAEIERVELFDVYEVRRMIERIEILSGHAEALAKYLHKERHIYLRS